jgi:hypothetical protein
MTTKNKPKPAAKKPETIDQPTRSQTLTSLPAKIVEENRKTTHHIVDTLAKTALAISNSENAGDKLNVIQSLWNMQKEAEDRQAEREFNVAKVSVAMELPPIPKTKCRSFVDKQNNTQTSYYADLDDIEGVLDPICRKYGIVKEYSTKSDGKGLAAQVCTVRHVSGHKETYEGPFMPIDNTGSKNANQAAGSTAKYGRRYALIGAFNIYHVDDDNDGAGDDVGAPKSDKFAERAKQQAAAAKPPAQPQGEKPKLSLEEAATVLEQKLQNTPQEKRGAVLMEHIKIIGAMEANDKLAAKASELRQLCVTPATGLGDAA